MRFELLCPSCGIRGFDFDDYQSMVLFAPNLALGQYLCPGCGLHLSATLKLSAQMRHHVQQKLNQEDAQTRAVTAGDIASPSQPGIGSAAQPGTSPDAQPAAQPAAQPNARSAVTVYDRSHLSYSSSLLVDRDEPGIEIISPLGTAALGLKAQLDYFKSQLESINTVDDAIEEIDSGYYHEKRDV